MATKTKNGGEEIFNRLVRSKFRFLVSEANHYKGYGLSLEELGKKRSIGLIHSIPRFDPKRGFKLITYTLRWICQNIIHAISVHTGILRIPVKIVALMHKITTTHRTFPQEFGQEASAEELAENLQLTMSNIEKILRAERTNISLDAPISENNNTCNLEFLEEKEPIFAEESLFHHFLHDEIDNLLRNLEPREQEIIRVRFGFDAAPVTLENIALSKEPTQHIENKIIHQFKARANNKILLGFLR